MKTTRYLDLEPPEIAWLTTVVAHQIRRARRQHDSPRAERRRQERGIEPHGPGRDRSKYQIEQAEKLLEKLKGLL